jgi:hypothetical protein
VGKNLDLRMTCGSGFHSAVVWTGEEIPTVRDDDGVQRQRPTIPADDPRWPTGCDGCGRRFEDYDERQVWLEQVYRRADTGELRVLHSSMHPPDIEPAEAGATWDAVWMPAQWRGADGISLMVRCPRNDGGCGGGSDWPVDMPSTGSGGRWARSGDPRRARVTASPSISIGKPGAPAAYHGWLQSGVLSDPI